MEIIKRYELFILGTCRCGCNKNIVIRSVRGYLQKYALNHRAPKVKYNCNKCKDKNWIIQCKCGTCVELLFFRDSFGVPREFAFAHAIRIREQTGEKNPMWKGGKHYNEYREYHFTRRVDHPHQNNGYVANHRLVMEQYLSILFDEEVFIPSEYDVHHINENKEDNSLINLEILLHGDHTLGHNMIDTSDRFCSNCGSKETYMKITKSGERRPDWQKDDKGGYECKSCYSKRNWYRYSGKNKE